MIENKGDLISREALKKDLNEFFDKRVIDNPDDIIHDVFCYIDNAPTVETPIEHFVDLDKIKTDCLNCEKFKRPQGEWISNNTDDNSFINRGRHCSLCGKTVEFSENYCPQCGAYMRGNNHV